MTNENTLTTFSGFYGTVNYYDYDGTGYALTDGAKYIYDKLSEKDAKVRDTLFKLIIMNTNYRYCFTATNLVVENKKVKIIVTDGNYNIIKEKIINSKVDLTDGVYRFFCYNYVIMAASEY